MSDLILSLSHYHRHIAIYVVQKIDTMLGRMCLLRDLHFTLLYVVVSISTCTFYLFNWVTKRLDYFSLTHSFTRENGY